MRDLDGKRPEAAVRNLKLALTFEPSNERFKEKLALAEKLLPKQEFKVGH